MEGRKESWGGCIISFLFPSFFLSSSLFFSEWFTWQGEASPLVLARLCAPLSLNSPNVCVYLDPLEKVEISVPAECVYYFDKKRFFFFFFFFFFFLNNRGYIVFFYSFLCTDYPSSTTTTKTKTKTLTT